MTAAQSPSLKNSLNQTNDSRARRQGREHRSRGDFIYRSNSRRWHLSGEAWVDEVEETGHYSEVRWVAEVATQRTTEATRRGRAGSGSGGRCRRVEAGCRKEQPAVVRGGSEQRQFIQCRRRDAAMAVLVKWQWLGARKMSTQSGTVATAERRPGSSEMEASNNKDGSEAATQGHGGGSRRQCRGSREAPANRRVKSSEPAMAVVPRGSRGGSTKLDARPRRQGRGR